MTFKQAVRKAHNLYGKQFAVVEHEHRWCKVYQRSEHLYYIHIFAPSRECRIVSTGYSEVSWEEAFKNIAEKEATQKADEAAPAGS